MKIGIIGCGWVGEPLGERLAEEHDVVGTTTTRSKLVRLEERGICPLNFELSEGDVELPEPLASVESLVLTVPPGRGGNRLPAYDKRLKALLDAFNKESNLGHVVYTSSTGVYPNLNRVVFEADVKPGEKKGADHLRRSAQAVRKAEGIIAGSGIPYTILRLAGLYGPGREPGRFFQGRTGIAGPDVPVNVVHIDDVIEVLRRVIQVQPVNEVFNVCADEHPSRSLFYTSAAEMSGYEPPSFDSATKPDFKVISNRRLKAALDYIFIYPDPLKSLKSHH